MRITVPSQWPRQLPARIAFVGEAPGETEEIKGVPLIGRSGKLFNKGLREAGISRWDCFVTNVLDFKLDDNDITSIATTKAVIVPDLRGDEWDDWLKVPVASGAYLPRAIAEPALGRLRAELTAAGANVIVPLGGLALWALLRLPGHGIITKLHGTVHQGVLVKSKVLPTFHPAYILRSYQEYPFFWADLMKANRESARPEMPVHDFGSFTEIEHPEDVNKLLLQLRPPVVVDIETSRMSAIDCIGFSDGVLTFSVPFFDNKTYKPYWNPEDEVKVRRAVCRWLESPVEKVFQNGGGYDLQVLWETWKVKTRGYKHDTRLLHHALWPELKKDLATMTATHTQLPAWKPVKGKTEKVED